MNRSLLDYWVGLFVALGIGALIFLALKVANQSGLRAAPSYPVVAYFDNIGGLKLRAPVKSAGVNIGRVTSIKLDAKSYQARVVMQLDNRYQFSSDSSASILTAGLLGEQYIGLEAGADTEMLQAGDTIQLTSSAVVLEKLIGAFGLKQASGASGASSE